MATKRIANQEKRPTIRDVAKLAGVSHTTVSFVINEVATETISEATRKRVLDAIQTLDYHPHEGARSLNRQSTQQIGLAVPEWQNAHYQEIAQGIETYAEEQGFGIFQTITHFEAEREQRCIQWLKQERFDGLILIPATGELLNDQLHELFEQHYAVVTLGIFESSVDNVRAESHKGERQILEHLYHLGHRRIGYIHGVANHSLFDYRLEACLRAQRELGIPVVDQWICRCGPTVESGYHATQALLADHGATERPTALVVVNDLLASATIAAINAHGLTVPHDMSVATFDNTQIANYMVFPPLTSVDYQANEMGRCAADLIISRLKNRTRPRAQFEMRAKLMVRASTGPAPNL